MLLFLEFGSYIIYTLLTNHHALSPDNTHDRVPASSSFGFFGNINYVQIVAHEVSSAICPKQDLVSPVQHGLSGKIYRAIHYETYRVRNARVTLSGL